MKIVFCGHDAAPSSCFKMVGEALTQMGHEVVMFLGFGKGLPFPDKKMLDDTLMGASLVVLGLSSSESFARSELLMAGEASARSISYGYFADIELALKRPWLKKAARQASFLVGMLPNDTESLREQFPNADFFYTGNPLRGTMAFPSRGREEIRSILNLAPTDKMILAPGRKFPAGNVEVWNSLIRNVHALGDQGKDFILYLSQHPGEPQAEAVRHLVYDELVSVGRSMSVRIDWLPEGNSTPIAIVAADLVAEFDGEASVRAGFLRKPLLKIVSEMQLVQFEAETMSRRLETSVNGTGLRCDASDPQLHDYILRLSDPNSILSQKYRMRQKEAYPTPTDPNGFRDAMVEALLSMGRR